MKQITSVQNPYIKELIQLQEKSRNRKKSGQFVMEGLREIEIAVRNGYEITSLLICSDFITDDALGKLKVQLQNNAEFIEISRDVYQKIAYRDSTEGIVAVAKIKAHDLRNLQLPENPLIIVLESPEKPGNIGAVLRTADAAHADAVIIADARTDLYNPNIVRSSVGALFTNRIAMATSEETLSFLKQHHIAVYSAILQEAVPYYTVDFKKGSAIVMGTEATGLTSLWRKESDANIIIPMEGQIDSMNVSVAAAVLMFEAKRQRMI